MKIEAGQVAVVTGGTSGIGFALAALLVRRGVDVMIADLREDAIPVAVDALSRGPGRAVGVRADVSVDADVDALADETIERMPFCRACRRPYVQQRQLIDACSQRIAVDDARPRGGQSQRDGFSRSRDPVPAAPLAARHAAMPPSSTRTARCPGRRASTTAAMPARPTHRRRPRPWSPCRRPARPSGARSDRVGQRMAA